MRRLSRTLLSAFAFRLLVLSTVVSTAAQAQPALAGMPVPPTRAEAPSAASVPAPSVTAWIVVPTRGDPDLVATWTRWQRASSGNDASAATEALKELLALKEELGIEDLDSFSTAMARASVAKREAGDLQSAVSLASASVELAPDLPWSHVALANAYFEADPGDVSQWVAAWSEAVQRLFSDPRFLLPALSDVFGALLVALMAAAATVVLVLFARNARYFMHDFHHLFPRAAARWQTALLASLALTFPIVFQLGALPVLLVLFAAVTLYLGHVERIVAGLALTVVAVLPLVGGAATSAIAFAGTPAEQVHLLERGGLQAASAAQEVRARIAQGRAGFEDLFALARYELRRGRMETASELFKKAAPLRPNDARVLTNLGNVRFALGDFAGAQTLYAQAAEADPALAAPAYNLSQVHYRRSATLTDAAKAQELERAQTAQENAHALEPSLLARAELPTDSPQPFNRLVISPGLRSSEFSSLTSSKNVSERVADQLAWKLIGMPAGPVAYVLPVLLIVASVGFGMLRTSLTASRRCEKCGRAVCRRCDPELSAGGGLCNQCINVFARKGLVAPQVKLRKQLEVDHYQARSERVAWILGVLCSGAGHVFSGRPLRGASWALLFSFSVALLLWRDGVLRSPWGDVPMWLRIVPVGVVLAVGHLLSLNSLRKAHTR